MDISTLGLALLWFPSMSVLCFALMYFDKRAAQFGEQRVSERTLLLFAYLGGGVGAVAGQQRFRHKTVKEPIRTLLKMSVYSNAVTLVFVSVPSLRDFAVGVIQVTLK